MLVASVIRDFRHYRIVTLKADGVVPLITAAGSGHGNNPTRGRYQTDERCGCRREDSARLSAPASIATPPTDKTVLHPAAQKGWNSTIRFLAEHGAALEAKDRNGKTPLDWANRNYSGG